jgi:hypothetical protein
MPSSGGGVGAGEYHAVVDSPPPGYRTLSEDTTYEVERVLVQALQQAGDLGRLARVGALGRMLRDIGIAELRREYPERTDRELRLLWVARWLPPETLAAVWGVDPTVADARC